MACTLTVLFRRDPSRDRHSEDIQYEGYQVLWPDGRPVTVGMDALCRHGQRLLGLGRHLAGRHERLIRLINFPLRDREDDLIKLPGHRVRRFFLERQGQVGRLHFLDGTPTAVVFRIGQDDPRVLRWCGLLQLRDGERQWFDLAASPLEHEPTHAEPLAADAKGGRAGGGRWGTSSASERWPG
jgi:hypothetical protein